MNPKIIGLIGTGASVLGVQAATKGLDATWKKVTGRQVPSCLLYTSPSPRD